MEGKRSLAHPIAILTEAYMKKIVCGGALIAALAVSAPAHATVDIQIDLATQHMHVQSASGTYDWPISSARAGYVTPTGTFAPQRLAEVYYSKKYDNAPMPHAIFFYYGFAIHGSYEVKHLGHPASHGCVRLSPTNAAKLYALVQNEGATITISGTPPGQAPYAAVADAGTKASGLFSFLGF
jgi:lipoprotein-anchoring transpeptidase ErfK/SrfK